MAHMMNKENVFPTSRFFSQVLSLLRVMVYAMTNRNS
jgi:hypothetical protein